MLQIYFLMTSLDIIFRVLLLYCIYSQPFLHVVRFSESSGRAKQRADEKMEMMENTKNEILLIGRSEANVTSFILTFSKVIYG